MDIIQPDLGAPVIALDGYAASGKGTARRLVAEALGFHQLDSGLLYRALAFLCEGAGARSPAEQIHQAQNMRFAIEKGVAQANGEPLPEDIGSEEWGAKAAIVAANQSARHAIKCLQLGMRQKPGLVADGRDMGFIFHEPFRFFITADDAVRAERRVKQLRALNRPADYHEILADIRRRDAADKTRAASPLVIHPEARIIDSSDMSPEQVRDLILAAYDSRSRA